MVLKQDPGDGKMKEISDYIYEGALAFLKAEYRLLTFFVIGVLFWPEFHLSFLLHIF
jgi:Na+/H+-translocating membrane pyrophosphatase